MSVLSAAKGLGVNLLSIAEHLLARYQVIPTLP